MLAIFLILGVATIILALWFYYVNYHKPQKEIKNQAERFTNKNWSVYIDRFAPLSTAIYDIVEKSFEDHQDALYVEKFQLSKYDVFLGNIQNRVFVQLHSPQMIKDFFLLDNDKNMIKQYYFTRHAKKMAGEAISFAEGELWKHKRKVISQFLNYGYLRDLGLKLYDTTEKKFELSFKQNMLTEKRDGKQVSEIYLQNLVELIPSTVIVEVFFGGVGTDSSLQIDGEVLPLFMRNTFTYLRNTTLDPVVRVLGIEFTKLRLREKDRKLHDRVSKWRSYVRNFIHSRISDLEAKKTNKINDQTKPKDLTQAFYKDFESKGKGQKEKKRMIELLIDDFADLLTAGTQTSSLTIIMAVYYVYQHKDVKDTLLKQLATIQNEDLKDVNNLKKLKYLECVILEALRLHHIASGVFPRRLVNDIKVGGVTIKKGSVVTVSSFAVHFKDENYENANCFKPQRWLQENGEIKPVDSTLYLPFGSGIRNCVGKPLAMIQTRLITAYFMKNFEAEFETLDLRLHVNGVAGYEPQPIKMKFWRRGEQEK